MRKPRWPAHPQDAVGTLDDVESATLFIKARGTFWDFNKAAKACGQLDRLGLLVGRQRHRGDEQPRGGWRGIVRGVYRLEYGTTQRPRVRVARNARTWR